MLMLLPACDESITTQAKDKAVEVRDQAADKSKDFANELGGQAKDKASELWADRPDSGDLSDRAQAMFAKGAAASGGGVEQLLAKGEQLAPAAFEVGKTLREAVEGDFDIEPIIQKLDDENAQAELDARIKDMPRVETIEGVDVGFKDMTRWDASGRETESAYLILWRRGDRLIGLVYRSRKRIHVDKLIAEAPRLVKLVSGAL